MAEVMQTRALSRIPATAEQIIENVLKQRKFTTSAKEELTKTMREYPEKISAVKQETLNALAKLKETIYKPQTLRENLDSVNVDPLVNERPSGGATKKQEYMETSINKEPAKELSSEASQDHIHRIREKLGRTTFKFGKYEGKFGTDEVQIKPTLDGNFTLKHDKLSEMTETNIQIDRNGTLKTPEIIIHKSFKLRMMQSMIPDPSIKELVMDLKDGDRYKLAQTGNSVEIRKA